MAGKSPLTSVESSCRPSGASSRRSSPPRNARCRASRTTSTGTSGSDGPAGSWRLRADARAVGHGQADFRRPGVAKRLHRRSHDAVFQPLDISRIGLGNGRVRFVAEHVDRHRPGMGVRGRDHHVGRRHARLALRCVADAAGRLAADVRSRRWPPTAAASVPSERNRAELSSGSWTPVL